MLKQLVMPAHQEFGPAETVRLTPITYREFTKLDLWFGASDMAYAEFLRHNKLADLADYNEEVLAIAQLVVTAGDYHLEFNPTGTEDGWITVPPMP
jgi:hypothetical protein